MEIKVNNANEPVWGEMSIKTKLPPNLEPLNDLAQNVYWSWKQVQWNFLVSFYNKKHKRVKI